MLIVDLINDLRAAARRLELDYEHVRLRIDDVQLHTHDAAPDVAFEFRCCLEDVRHMRFLATPPGNDVFEGVRQPGGCSFVLRLRLSVALSAMNERASLNSLDE